MGLEKRYGEFTAVDNLSLNIKKNSFTGLLGPNGAGKSTTLKMLTHLINTTSGEAYINGIDVTRDPKAALTGVGTVVETPEFYTYLTPRETFELLGQLIGMSSEKISAETASILEMVKMTEWADKKIGTFSKGMRQRVALGQAFLDEPSIIILDEPTSGLDPRGMAEMRDVLKNIRNGRDVTVVMSSHMLHEVSDLCDRVAILNHGKLILDDTIDAVTSRSGARQIIIKLDHTPTTDDVAKVAAISGITSASRFGVDIEAKMPSEFARSPDLFRAISDLGIGVYNMYENESLEATYLSLIKESR
ncbi:MAG: ABC transporter ATP-binding protein [Methanomassiliicoccaceae archaeon]|nr:ABC transporter ATP-binding protein [Methanomassiliicoccaceae archaeon]